MKSSRRVMLATAVAAAAVVAWASPSFAHVDPDPPAVQAGTAVTVQFGVDYFPRSRGVSTLSSGSVIVKILREMGRLYKELRTIEPLDEIDRHPPASA